MGTIDRATLKRAKRRDRVARWVIVLGGVTIIVSVIAILVLIVGTTAPLFRPAQSREVATMTLPAGVAPADVLAIGIEMGSDERSPVACLLTRDGVFAFVDLTTQETVARQTVAPPEKPALGKTDSKPVRRTVVAVEQQGASRYTLAWSNGAVSLVEVRAAAQFDAQGRRTVQHAVKELASRPPEPGPPTVKAMARQAESGATTCVQLLQGNRVVAVRQVSSEDLLGEKETKSQTLSVDTAGLATISAMAMDRGGTTLYAGTEGGELARWQFDDDGSVKVNEQFTAFADHRRITALAMVFGDVSLAVGDDRGEVTTWFPVRHGGTPRLTRIHTLSSHASPVREILPSSRTKSLLSIAEDGSVHLDHMTSERQLLSLDASLALRAVGLAPRGNAIVATDSSGSLLAWEVDAPHSEVSWKTLFGKVHYEGYDEPSYAWQTTGGDDFEMKVSLVPVISGTLKGTFYAMLLAVPLALFGAVYTSHFTTPAFKRAIKPVVEIMAAVPSVVLGFLVALWLAPIMERWILALILAFATLPLMFVAFMVLWQSLRRHDWAKRLENGYEFLLLVPVLLAGIILAIALVPTVDSFFAEPVGLFDVVDASGQIVRPPERTKVENVGGNFRLWLYQSLGMRYDQRNCIIVAFGLGFAVIPIIFSIAEDSLSSVPYTLTASSMALGASRWQTLWRVVLPSASPGIFAGIMIGFGRAVGETMIVLMATGNTPILDWSPLDGMRTLSANIATEIAEVPFGGTVYRVLFLCGVLLFLLTFALNTAAELVRQRLRKRYGRF